MNEIYGVKMFSSSRALMTDFGILDC